jgi:hypothetical protein
MITEIKSIEVNQFPIEIENKPEIKSGDYDLVLTCYVYWKIEVSEFRNFAEIEIKTEKVVGYLEIFFDEKAIGRIDLSELKLKPMICCKLTDSIKPTSLTLEGDELEINFEGSND